MRRVFAVLTLNWLLFSQQAGEWTATGWRLIRGGTAGLELPNAGTQQTSATVFDIDGDKVNDFVITERTTAPGVAGYLRRSGGWRKIVIDAGRTPIEAGATFEGVDNDGDLDFAAGGEGRARPSRAGTASGQWRQSSNTRPTARCSSGASPRGDPRFQRRRRRRSRHSHEAV